MVWVRWTHALRINGAFINYKSVFNFCGFSWPRLAPIVLPHSSAGFCELSLTFGCGSFYLFPSITGWSLSDNNWGSTNLWVEHNVIRHHYIDFFSNHFWLYPSFWAIQRLGTRASGSVKSSVSLRLDQSWVGLSHNVCTTLTQHIP